MAILISNELYNNFKIGKCLELGDNVIGIKFENVENGETIALFCVYLPPDGSKYSIENEMTLNNLTIEIYNQCEADLIIVCGDFNARIGEKCDIPVWDSMLPHSAIDKTVNAQGERLLTFVKDIKGCVLNGRLNPEHDDYTSVTAHKGSSVVDYFITKQSDVSGMHQLWVYNMIELISELKLEGLTSNQCSVPDQFTLS